MEASFRWLTLGQECRVYWWGQSSLCPEAKRRKSTGKHIRLHFQKVWNKLSFIVSGLCLLFIGRKNPADLSQPAQIKHNTKKKKKKIKWASRLFVLVYRNKALLHLSHCCHKHYLRKWEIFSLAHQFGYDVSIKDKTNNLFWNFAFKLSI